ncbi:ATP-dependent RNA helicase [Wickerhamomyces ciferrii]|uniref:ATP-dependent RNA helicase n=1 Tax=Wickerhamomyces ciferrii (strain ATCC 14091 / BCRC 22168 / CBS 111 / JCM 3599 / NBRC 0793 / NRRL Y-1031 F-60-10) TaxID=1206466 RepID=K0KV44_WICCF|nr:ATP-dependent RNA helicase [Wickerhamomyces ciferrii]CCH47116.1 ATP-dependent RNA helicase [Wickerhamomyces ciferrii]
MDIGHPIAENYVYDIEQKIIIDVDKKKVIYRFGSVFKKFRNKYRNKIVSSYREVNDLMDNFESVSSPYDQLAFMKPGYAVGISRPLDGYAKLEHVFMCGGCESFCHTQKQTVDGHINSGCKDAAGNPICLKVRAYGFRIKSAKMYFYLRSDAPDPTPISARNQNTVQGPAIAAGADDPIVFQPLKKPVFDANHFTTDLSFSDLLLVKSGFGMLLENLKESGILSGLVSKPLFSKAQTVMITKACLTLKDNWVKFGYIHTQLPFLTTSDDSSFIRNPDSDRSKSSHIERFIVFIRTFLIMGSYEAYSKDFSDSQNDNFEMIHTVLERNEHNVDDHDVNLFAKAFADFIFESCSMESSSKLLIDAPLVHTAGYVSTGNGSLDGPEFVVSVKPESRIQIYDAVSFFYKVALGTAFNGSDHASFVSLDNYIAKRDHVSRLLSFLDDRKKARTVRDNLHSHRSITYLDESGDNILIDNAVFRKDYFPKLYQGGIDMFIKKLNDFGDAYNQPFPEIKKVTDYLDQFADASEDVLNNDVGFYCLDNVQQRSDLKITSCSNELSAAIKKNPMKVIKQLQNIINSSIFNVLLFAGYGISRGSEMSELSFRNTPAAPRGIFYNGKLALSRTKTTEVLDAFSSIIRMIPVQIKSLIYYYLYVVRDLELKISETYLSDAYNGLDGGLSSGDDVTGINDILDSQGAMNFDKSAKLKPHQVLNFFVFADGFTKFSYNKVSSLFKTYLDAILGPNRLTLTTFRHVGIHFQRDILYKDHELCTKINSITPVEMSSGHSVRTGVEVYAQQDSITGPRTFDNRILSILGKKWQLVLEGKAEIMNQEHAVSLDGANLNFTSPTTLNLWTLLKQLFGSNFDFFDQSQETSTKLGLATNESLLLNKRTGAGKTIMSLAPFLTKSMLFHKLKNRDKNLVKPILIVVIPFVGLCNQYQNQLKEFKPLLHNDFTFGVYKDGVSEQTLRSWDVVLVQLENGARETFVQFVHKYESPSFYNGRWYHIDRIIFDEIHQIIYADSYRHQSIANINSLIKDVNIPLTLLSGSLLQRDFPQILQKLNRVDIKTTRESLDDSIHPSRLMNIIKDKEWIRSNITIHTKFCENNNELNDVVKDFHNKFANVHEKLIVFMNNKHKLANLKCLLDDESVNEFNGEMSHEEKIKVQQDFGTGKCKTLLSTIAGNNGLSFNNVTKIIIIGNIGSIESIQALGRGARSPKETCSVLFLDLAENIEAIYKDLDDLPKQIYTDTVLSKIDLSFYKMIYGSGNSQLIKDNINEFINVPVKPGEIWQFGLKFVKPAPSIQQNVFFANKKQKINLVQSKSISSVTAAASPDVSRQVILKHKPRPAAAPVLISKEDDLKIKKFKKWLIQPSTIEKMKVLEMKSNIKYLEVVSLIKAREYDVSCNSCSSRFHPKGSTCNFLEVLPPLTEVIYMLKGPDTCVRVFNEGRTELFLDVFDKQFDVISKTLQAHYDNLKAFRELRKTYITSGIPWFKLYKEKHTNTRLGSRIACLDEEPLQFNSLFFQAFMDKVKVIMSYYTKQGMFGKHQICYECGFIEKYEIESGYKECSEYPEGPTHHKRIYALYMHFIQKHNQTTILKSCFNQEIFKKHLSDIESNMKLGPVFFIYAMLKPFIVQKECPQKNDQLKAVPFYMILVIELVNKRKNFLF